MRIRVLFTVLVALTALAGTARSNVIAPWLLSVTEPVSLLLFVTPDCVGCSEIYSDVREAAPILVVSHEPVPGFEPFALDVDDIITKIFRVTAYPTLVVLRGRQEQIRQVEHVDLEIVAATVAALLTDRMPRTWPVGINVGERVPGEYANVTGLIIYSQQNCEACEKEAEQIDELLADATINISIVGQELSGEPSSTEDTAVLWGLPGAPMHVYLRDGVPLWIDTGYRPDLVELVQRLAIAAQ